MKSKIAIILIISSIMIALPGCKKKKEPKEEQSAQPSQTSLNTEKLHGYLFKDMTYFFRKDTLWENDLFLSVGFFANPVDRDSVLIRGTPMNVGAVFYNDSMLKKSIYNNGSYYTRYSWGEKTGIPPNRWKVTGEGEFTGFTFTDSQPEPTFSGINSMIDTIRIGKENVLKITGLKNADKIDVYIDGGSFCAGSISVPKTLSPPFSEVKIAAWETTPLIGCTAPSLDLLVKAYRSNFQEINGRILDFQSCIVFKITVPALY